MKFLENLSGKLSEKFSQKFMENIIVALWGFSHKTPDEILEIIPEGFLKKTSERLPEETFGEIPIEIPEKNSEYNAEEALERGFGEITNEIQQKFPRELLKELSKKILLKKPEGFKPPKNAKDFSQNFPK